MRTLAVGVALSVQLGVPLVHTKHSRLGNLDTDQGDSLGARLQRFAKAWEAWGLRHATRVIAVSRATAEVAIELGAGEKLCLISNGARIPQVAIRPADFGQTGRLRVLFVGRLFTVKRPDIVLRAVSCVENVSVRFVGDGPMLEELKRLAEELGVADRTEFAGWCGYDEMSTAYLNADVVVLPSLWEAFGLTNLEAMAHGRFAIGTNVGGISEQIEHMKTGLLFRVDDYAELASHLEWIQRNPQEAANIAEAGRQVALSRDSWSMIAKRTAEQYDIARSLYAAKSSHIPI
jgi:glycosyltransferase involved in cell wall biosynthesis